MPKKTIQEVAEITDLEGLDYSILHLAIPAEEIEDPALAAAWADAKLALEKIEAILEPFMP
jgi:hypothetical protein